MAAVELLICLLRTLARSASNATSLMTYAIGALLNSLPLIFHCLRCAQSRLSGSRLRLRRNAALLPLVLNCAAALNCWLSEP